MNQSLLNALETAEMNAEPIDREAALMVLRCHRNDLPRVMAAASAQKQRFGHAGVALCSIINARSGACPENCAFCAQSAHHSCTVESYPLIGAGRIAAARELASRQPISHFGIVTSGPGLDDEDLDTILEALGSSGGGAAWCASLGALSTQQLLRLREAGLTRFHHNLETSRRFFPQICTTHTFDDRLATIRAAHKVGLEVCSGGIIGMGETLEDRVDLALTLAREKVASIPINFLIPVPGTRLENMPVLPPLDMIRTIAMFRLTNPSAEIRVCAGRTHLRDLQSLIFSAGASGMMIGDLLTVAGRNPEDDLQMLADLELLDEN